MRWHLKARKASDITFRDEEDPDDIIRQAARIRIGTKILAKSDWAGRYRSLSRGEGVEFQDLREYIPGDDVRAIDWKVTARLGTPYIREFYQERDNRIYLLLDFSGSVSFGSVISKRRKTSELAAGLILSAADEGISSGLAIFTDQVERFIPARRGHAHAVLLITTLARHRTASRRTDPDAPVRDILQRVKRRSTVVIISDFFDLPSGPLLAALGHRHEVVLVRVSDPGEHELPDAGLLSLEDPESGEQALVDTGDERIRLRYASLVADRERTIRQQIRKSRTRLVDVSTSDPVLASLKRFSLEKTWTRN